MADTQATRLRGGVGCWAGPASSPTANWWRRDGAGRVCRRGRATRWIAAFICCPKGLPHLSQVVEVLAKPSQTCDPRETPVCLWCSSMLYMYCSRRVSVPVLVARHVAVHEHTAVRASWYAVSPCHGLLAALLTAIPLLCACCMCVCVLSVPAHLLSTHLAPHPCYTWCACQAVRACAVHHCCVVVL